jgi:hypothetical protein
MTRLWQGLSLVLIAAASAVMWLLVTLWQEPDLNLTGRQVTEWQPDLNGTTQTGLSGQDTQTGSENNARPVFAPTRKPFVPTQPAVESPSVVEAPASLEGDSTQFQLKGVFRNGSKSSAWIITPDQPNGAWFSVDAEIQGWRVRSIETDAVVLATAQRSVTLWQYPENKAANPN